MRNLTYGVAGALFIVWMARPSHGLAGTSRLRLFWDAMSGSVYVGTTGSQRGSNSSTSGGSSTAPIKGTSGLPSSAQSDVGGSAATQGTSAIAGPAPTI